MTIPAQITALRAALLSNTLSPDQQTNLVEALDAATPFLSVPVTTVLEGSNAASNNWIAGLYAILGDPPSGGGGGSVIPWIDVPASGTQAVLATGNDQYFAVNSTGASAATLDFPASPIDGQSVWVTLFGATAAAGVNFVPGTGTQIMPNFMPGSEGTFLTAGQTSTANTQGQLIRVKWDAAANTWRRAS